MPLSKKATWGFVAESNNREVNQKVRWLLQNRPEDPEARRFKEQLDKPALALAAIPKHMLPEGAVVREAEQTPVGERPHRKRHHRKGCPRHTQHVLEKQRETLTEAAQAVAKGNPAQALRLRRQVEEIAQAPLRARTATEEANLIGAAGVMPPPEAAEATTATGGEKPKHLSRKERQLAALLCDPRPEHIVPGLHVPQSVGKGMAMFLTGGYTEDPHMYDRRPLREHPNFAKVARVFDVEKDSEFHGSPTPPPAAGEDAQRNALAFTAPLARRKLMALPTDKSKCRLKDEVKAHLELANTSAKSMMRGGARKA
uniref:Uncharacterized protein n=1 Tax=Neobodo designis TaxID=312471 RepID=A0A7S1MFZ9_NEODS|mmetsp:Transcript_39901/g.123297  ORF Transcript_39901/g.123297 Transcript_39901/m.123297 type:complete len:313 (+) Transcript_39901:94-1032(+)|eukprot:CAMPEP_0174855318 /NCGR_PEP_ID=MMETSP1114-20130205/32975_1 /TAXON_ID=312471 /ORGANISM="Neobodo designis, Strain CCAP 1951/1" /LENGTH=312 /DNA_ID=CAMNT_0016090053 /DNA_START=90 /DNA_END=1028 /DNA_ORIENTATION=+